MTHTTIDFGIDLGTTNSAIAALRGRDTEVFKNNENFEYTPSAVYIDKNNRLWVGRRAKERLEEDSDNAFAEFKLQMGTAAEYVFRRSGRRMKPEELSAEVLKALKADVMQRTGENVQAAVVTVPAAFELPQCEATRKAAELAGFSASPLLQEPVAAALAYGFQSESDRVFWLVYDLGGGTFDAAIMQVRDGVIQVVNHGGDNHLGGKLIDWEIVDQLLIPAATRQFRLGEFRRGNPKWIAAIAKLKYHAEEAKIRVSRDDTAEIHFDHLCEDDAGQRVEFEFELTREQVQRLMEPFLVRSINICKKVLTEKRLAVSNVEKVLLVGGPTLTPYLRERLLDREHGLGIPLEFSADPLTVVAQGAAIFAGTQLLEGVPAQPVASGQYAIELDYKPVGVDTEPLVGGRIVGQPGEDLSHFTIEFVNEGTRPAWRSGKYGLSPEGGFVLTLWAEKGEQNTFRIELHDGSGLQRQTVPDRFTYTIGLTITDPPLIHSVGVAMANNQMDKFIEKGTPLPSRRREIHRTAFEVRRGQAGDLIRIPVVEGENLTRADRNSLIGFLTIESDQIKRDVPAGSEVEITLDIDKSRLVRTRAYIPILDEEYENVLNLVKEIADPAALKKDIDQEKKRLAEARKKAIETRDAGAQQTLQRIDGERMEHDVDAAYAASRADRDAADKCEKRLRELKAAIDEVEDALEWPSLMAEAEEQIKTTRGIVQQNGTASDKSRFATLERETREAMITRDPDLLRRRVSELHVLTVGVLREQPGFWVAFLDNLEGRKANMRDQAQANQLIAQGRRAIVTNDLPGLQAAVQQLIGLLPADQQEQVPGYGGKTQR